MEGDRRRLAYQGLLDEYDDAPAGIEGLEVRGDLGGGERPDRAALGASSTDEVHTRGDAEYLPAGSDEFERRF